MKFRYHRRPFTLLEALLALALTAALMTVLAYFYRQLEEINIAAEKSFRSLYQRAYVESRLATVLPKAVNENTSKKDFFFFTTGSHNSDIFDSKNPSLIFTYDNGIDLDVAFANHVLGRLFVDSDKHLVLATWPSTNRWKEDKLPPVKREVLFDGVEALDFSFFVAPDVDRTRVVNPTSLAKSRQVFTPEPAGGWIPEWRADYYQLPAIMKVHMLRRDPLADPKSPPQDILFSFPLPNSLKVIFYTK